MAMPVPLRLTSRAGRCGQPLSRGRWSSSRRTASATVAAAATQEKKSAPPGGGAGKPKAKPPVEAHVSAAGLAKDTTVLSVGTGERLKFEVEYGRRAGTTDNTYVLSHPTEAYVALVDVPDDQLAAEFERVITSDVDVAGVLLTRFDPKAAKALFAIARRHVNTRGKPLPVFASTPATDTLNEAAEKANVGDCIDAVPVKKGSVVDVFGDGTRKLAVIPAPTPRWPYAVIYHDAETNVAFTGKFFASHLDLPTSDDVKVQWDKALQEHRHYYECMLAPVDTHVDSVLDRLNASPLADSGYWPLEAKLPLLKNRRGGGGGGGGKGGWSFEKMVRSLTLQGSSEALKRTGIDASSPGCPRVEEAGAQRSSSLPIAVLAPLHGPPSFGHTAQLLDSYRKWTDVASEQRQACSVGILYASAYGHTASLAQAIARGVQRAGLGVEMVNCELMTASEIDEVMTHVDGFAIGSPTLAGNMPTPVATTLGRVVAAPGNKGKPSGVFGSFGWSGEAVDLLNDKLTDAGFRSAFSPIRCKFSPTTKMLMTCEESGRALARAVLEKRKQEAKNSGRAMPGKAGASAPAFTTPIAQAVGRVIGTLTVVTCRRGDASAALVASWVSQASFSPPGLTIAVKNDRASEPLLQVGDRFGLSILAEGFEGDALKYFLKPFEPGVDRIAGYEGITYVGGEEKGGKKGKAKAKAVKTEDVEVTPDADPELELAEPESPDDKFAVITEAASWCGCVVKSRMETGDHMVLYAEVVDGAVLDEGKLGSLHYRKTGLSY